MRSVPRKPYIGWVIRYVRFHGTRHPRELGEPEVSAFLTHLAVDGAVAASTQNLALSALLFLYREVLGQPLEQTLAIAPAKRSEHLPVVLSRTEARTVLAALTCTHHLMASLLYTSGLRLLECLRLRAKDIDFDRQQLIVRRGKGDKDLTTMLPVLVQVALRDQLAYARQLHDADLRRLRPR